jgi:phosphonatase-like hydrolase
VKIRPRLVVFDLTGTTVEDDAQIATAFREALDSIGVVVGDGQLAAVRGASKRDAIARLIPRGKGRSDRSERAYAEFRRRLAAGYAATPVRAIEGAARTLKALRRAEVSTALATGLDRDVTLEILRSVSWHRGIFDAIVCGDEVGAGRPAPFLIFRAMERTGTMNVGEVMAVGDTANDLLAGHNAGIRWNVGVLSGAHTRAQLEVVPHTALIRSVADLPALLRS